MVETFLYNSPMTLTSLYQLQTMTQLLLNLNKSKLMLIAQKSTLPYADLIVPASTMYVLEVHLSAE